MSQSTTVELDLSTHAPASYSDPTWIDDYITKMGEKAFWEYKKNVYNLLDSVKPREWLKVVDWAKPVNFDLFVKIAAFFIQESECSYQANKQFTIIKRQFDARELETTLKVLRRKRWEKDNGGDGHGTQGELLGAAPVPTPESEIQNKQGG